MPPYSISRSIEESHAAGRRWKKNGETTTRTKTKKKEEQITGNTESSVRVTFRAAGMWPTAEDSEMES